MIKTRTERIKNKINWIDDLEDESVENDKALMLSLYLKLEAEGEKKKDSETRHIEMMTRKKVKQISHTKTPTA